MFEKYIGICRGLLWLFVSCDVFFFQVSVWKCLVRGPQEGSILGCAEGSRAETENAPWDAMARSVGP